MKQQGKAGEKDSEEVDELNMLNTVYEYRKTTELTFGSSERTEYKVAYSLELVCYMEYMNVEMCVFFFLLLNWRFDQGSFNSLPRRQNGTQDDNGKKWQKQ